MKELKSRRGFGPFVAKNYWSICIRSGGASFLTTSRMLSAALERESFCFCCMAIPDICWFAPARRTLQTSSTTSSWTSGTSGGAYSFGVFGRHLIGGSFIGSKRYKLKRWRR